jgi:hypothetical protein
MNLIPVISKTSSQAHSDRELDMLGVPKKLVKYVVNLFKNKK